MAARRPGGALTSADVSRSLTTLTLAAGLAVVAAMGAGGDPTIAAPGAIAGVTAPGLAPAPAVLDLDAPTDDLTPRSVAPERGERLATVSAPEPPRPRELRGTGVLLAASGTSQDAIDRGGRTVRFSVEVEQATGLDPDVVAAQVESALYDERSWARNHKLQRVAPGDARIHVVIATPDTVDTICRRAGLHTAGWLSCWSGRTAAINLDRWNLGVAHFDDLDVYRRYVVNHEFGHGLGHGHVGCPGRGRTAPLMQQQSKSLSGCVANEWQFP